jgi:hypothetical protein
MNSTEVINLLLLRALRHTERRLNEIPHQYMDTNWQLLRDAYAAVNKMSGEKESRTRFLECWVADLDESLREVRYFVRERKYDLAREELSRAIAVSRTNSEEYYPTQEGSSHEGEDMYYVQTEIKV